MPLSVSFCVGTPCAPLAFGFFNFTQEGILLIRIIEFTTIGRNRDWRVSYTKKGSYKCVQIKCRQLTGPNDNAIH